MTVEAIFRFAASTARTVESSGNVTTITTKPNASKPASKIGALRTLLFELLREHERQGDIPTNGHFVFYELEQRGARLVAVCHIMFHRPMEIRHGRHRELPDTTIFHI